jgi:hypothetical protein
MAVAKRIELSTKRSRPRGTLRDQAPKPGAEVIAKHHSSLSTELRKGLIRVKIHHDKFPPFTDRDQG